jgi:hydrogenase assembly chaperone HypC/HupF
MRVVRVDDGLACCEAEGEQQSVEIALVGDVTPGDEVLVHAGVALVRSAGGAGRGGGRSETA